MPILIEMLKKASVKVQCNALETIEALTRRYASMCVPSIPKIAAAISPLINDQELSTTYLALKVASSLIKIGVGQYSPKDFEGLMQAVIASVSMDQISGIALDALSEFISISATNKIINQHMI